MWVPINIPIISLSIVSVIRVPSLKIDHLKMFIAADEPDVMMITEVIPKAQKNPILEIQLSIEGYEVYKNFNNIDLDLGSYGM